MIHWEIKGFDELTSRELYKILQLRINVFMLEQNCLYPECDDKDIAAHHLFAMLDSEIIAYCRLLAPGISYEDASIGRVIVVNSHRGKDLGNQLMQKAVDKLYIDYPNFDIRISAQAHLQRFYENLGFAKISEVYLEDDIPHIAMLLNNKKEE